MPIHGMARHLAGAALCLMLLASPVDDVEAKVDDDRPNIIIIMADDLGYSDLGAFGGEIRTPNLDRLAERGVRFSDFHTAPTCSPTRAMLLTGKDNHRVGLGTMGMMRTPEVEDVPGYEGYLTSEAETLAERLGRIGYSTLMAGKWHLGLTDDRGPAARGFLHSYALLEGSHNHFGADQTDTYREAGRLPSYRQDGVPTRYPVGEYSSDFFTSRLINQVHKVHAEDAGRPFFAYLAFTAPHWPLQAPAEIVARYRGRYDAGPLAIRNERLSRMQALGFFGSEAGDTPPSVNEWDELPGHERAAKARAMEIYAAMIERMDWNVGRLLDELQEIGELDETIILFLSDNGAEGISFNRPILWPEDKDIDIDNSLQSMGTSRSYISSGHEWAAVSNVPFRGLKGSVWEGGTRTAALIAGPGISGGTISDALVHVLDVFPTMTDFAEPDAGQGDEDTIGDLDGLSWKPMLEGKSSSVREPMDVLATELFFERSVRDARYKAVYRPPSTLGRLIEQADVVSSDGSGPTRWELYDIEADPAESRDLSSVLPEKLCDLVSEWHSYARHAGVVTR